ncbi:MAG: 2-C-methyl-D-erythritol 4-phosphate cytidylyltransferase [Bacteroidales bacterium]|nr:2-C-methyl-D-erythritol 4-phosphate cytidylyltransferase [Bacteroidales bacterium]
MKVVAVILAAGKGSRWGGNIPKQFYIVNGKKMYAHSVEVFNKHPQIDEIVIVIPKLYKDIVKEDAVKNNWNKIVKIIRGGTERHYSTANALRALKNESGDTIVLFHDGARPYVDSSIIDRVIAALQTANAVTAAIPATDTIAQINDNKITNIPDRNFLYHIQTPQGFRIDTVRSAYAKARKDKNLTATDDCGIVLKYLPKEKVIIVSGSEKNVKCTFNKPI